MISAKTLTISLCLLSIFSFLWTLRSFLLWQVIWIPIPACSSLHVLSVQRQLQWPLKRSWGRKEKSGNDRAGRVQGLRDMMLFLIFPLADPGILDRSTCRFGVFLSIFCLFQCFALWSKDYLLLGICKIPCRVASKYNLVLLSYI